MASDNSIMLHRHGLVKAAASALRDRCGISGGERLVLAVSGGADSVALLRAMAALAGRREWSLELHVAHVNHHLRPEAQEDARFTGELAGSLGLTAHHRDIRPGEAGGNVENAARHMRYAALLEVANTVQADAIVTAHHADDQLETLLMRLVRGSSVHGMRGMLSRRRIGGTHLVRPLLGLTREHIRSFLAEIGQTWREDQSNSDVSKARALLRSRVLPALRQLRPDAAVKAGDTAAQMAQASELIERWRMAATRRHVTRSAGSAVMERSVARRMHPAELTELVRGVCVEMGSPADALPARTLELIARAARDTRGDERSYHIAGALRVVVTSDALRWETAKPGDAA